MRILHAKDEATGAPIENAFVAMEGYDTVLGECQVEARSYLALLPERPHIVDIAAKGSSEALDALYGAGTALAQLLSRRSRQNSEIRIECGEAQRERLRALGYRERDALVRMRRKAFAEGMATSTEVVDAEVMLSKVRIAVLLAYYEYDVALANLLSLCGAPERFERYSLCGRTESHLFGPDGLYGENEND